MKKLYFSFFAPDTRGFVFTFLAMTGVLLFITHHVIAIGVAGIFLSVVAFLVVTNFRTYDKIRQRGIDLAAANWVRGGADAEEVQDRFAQLKAQGAEGILVREGLLFDGGPAVNVDGTPMIGSLDINGRPFGAAFEGFVTTDASSGMSMDGNATYSPPIGMDSHNSGGTGF
jgi:hypothetical protein